MEVVPAKSILHRSQGGKQWFGMDYTMNLYRGCSHGCIYCDSRSSCYGNFDFDRIKAKENCIQTLEQELRAKRKTGVVGVGAMSDPYNPYEEKLGLTRQALFLLQRYGFGVSLATKSDLVLRDAETLASIMAQSDVIVKFSITCADDALSRQIEPGVCVTSKRFEALKTLREQGLYTGVLLMPVLPFLTDTQENILEIVELAAKHGAKFIYPMFGVTLRDNQRTYFYQQLDRRFPGVRANYEAQYGEAYMCDSPNARHLWHIFCKACEAHGMVYRMQEIIAGYRTDPHAAQLTF